YQYRTPAWTVSVKVDCWIGAGVMGSSLSIGLVPRSTMYPARSFSLFDSQIKSILPSPGTACRSLGAAGGNVSLSVSHLGGSASLWMVRPARVSTVRIV